MKILLDTNVLISAFIVHGVCSDLLDHCMRHHKLITSEFILGEFRKNMIQKLKYSDTEVEEAIELLELKMEKVIPAIPETSLCRDPDDNIIIGTAIAGNAICIVTGDKDLLALKRFDHIDIVSPSEFSEYEAMKQAG